MITARRDEIYKKMQALMDESGCYVFFTHEVVGAIHKDTIVPGLKPNGESLLSDFKTGMTLTGAGRNRSRPRFFGDVRSSGMLNYAVKRLGLAVAIVSVAMFLLFCMIYLVPGDPRLRRAGAAGHGCDGKRRFGSRWGWISRSGCSSGTSSPVRGPEIWARRCLSGRPVLDVVLEQLALHAGADCRRNQLVGRAWEFRWAAGRRINRGSLADRLVGILSVAVIAVPSFVIAIYALLIFAVTLKWLPCHRRRASPATWATS